MKVQLVISTLLTITSSTSIFCTDQCKASGIRCVDPYTYQLCMNLTSDYAVGTVDAQKCPDGTICDGSGSFACKVGTITTTTPIPTTSLPACSDNSKYPTESCNTYFQCVQVWWWWEAAVQTCPDGQNFNPTSLECCSSDEYPCGPTTPIPVVTTTLPACSGDAKYPAESCNTYFQCVQNWWWWERAVKTCADGQNFDPSLLECVSVAQYPCGSTSTTSKTSIPSVTTNAPSTVPACSSDTKYATESCNTYYHCVNSWFLWWQLNVETCPDGENFDPASLECVSSDQYPCGSS